MYDSYPVQARFINMLPSNSWSSSILFDSVSFLRKIERKQEFQSSIQQENKEENDSLRESRLPCVLSNFDFLRLRIHQSI